jgi:hypothetical protein
VSGGLLLLRCLQFPLAPAHAHPANDPHAEPPLGWPGLFAYKLSDLLAGLGRPVASPAASTPSNASTSPSQAAAAATASAPPQSRTLPPLVLAVADAAYGDGAVAPGRRLPRSEAMLAVPSGLVLLTADRGAFAATLL